MGFGIRRFAWCARLAAVVPLIVLAAMASPSRAATPLSSHVLRIYPLGDSITVGVTGVDNNLGLEAISPGGYRAPLDSMLSGDDIWHQFVGTSQLNHTPNMSMRGQQWHDGHGGYRIDQVMTDLTGVAHGPTDDGGYWLTGIRGRRAAIYPNVVIIHLGTNDIFQRWDPAYDYPTPSGLADYSVQSQRDQFVADMTVRLERLVEKIYQLRPAARIVLSSIVPFGTVTCDQVTGEYGRGIEGLVQKEQRRGRAMVFANVWQAFTLHVGRGTTTRVGLMSEDTHHPTALGYQVMARVYLDAMRRLLISRH
jgi:lysophospholipase L1-like esterase